MANRFGRNQKRKMQESMELHNNLCLDAATELKKAASKARSAEYEYQSKKDVCRYGSMQISEMHNTPVDVNAFTDKTVKAKRFVIEFNSQTICGAVGRTNQTLNQAVTEIHDELSQMIIEELMNNLRPVFEDIRNMH